MSNYLTNKGHIIISSGATPTAAEIAAQFSPFQNGGLNLVYDSLATEDSGRSVDGVMHIQWILSRTRKLEIQLPPGTSAEISPILDKVLGRKFYVTFWDLAANAETTKHMYCSNGKGSFYSGVVRNGLYTGVSFNCIELND